MSDPYEEATRHERTGLSTFAKVFLVGGGLLATLVIAVGIWMAIASRSAVEERDEWGRYSAEIERELVVEVEAVREEAARAAAELAQARRRAVAQELAAAAAQMQQNLAELEARVAANAERAAAVAEVRRSVAEAQDPVAAELNRAVVTALTAMFEDKGYDVEPWKSGVGVQVTERGGAATTIGLGFASVNEILDGVARGEMGFADAKRRGEARIDPDWVPVYPGSYSTSRIFGTREDFAFGFAVFVAQAGGHEILDWYRRTAERMAQDGTTFDFRGIRDEEDRSQDLHGDLGRYAMAWDDHMVTVFVTEDDRGDSLFVLLYRGLTQEQR